MHKKSFSMKKQVKKLSNLFNIKILLPCKHKFKSIFGWLRSKAVAFTMAEILLSLTIIGVVAAITLPSLTGNINERTWNTQRKALYARMSQAIAMMGSLNGYGISSTESLTEKNATQAFVTEGLSKVLKINNICDNTHLQDCGIPAQITQLSNNASLINTPKTLLELNFRFDKFSTESGSSMNYSQFNTDAAAFETQNGESIIAYYNPNCTYETITVDGNEHWNTNLIQPTMCVNFIYDLNGTKGPNQIGKDIGFVTAFYPTDTIVVSVSPVSSYSLGSYADANSNYYNMNKMCRENVNLDSRATNIDELKSIFVNQSLLSLSPAAYFSNTKDKNNNYLQIKMYSGVLAATEYNESNPAVDASYQLMYCIKR